MTIVLDQELSKAIQSVVSRLNQPKEVATRLVNWLELMSAQEMSEIDKGAQLEVVLSALDLGAEEDAD